MRSLNYFELGASLYTPCNHPKLVQILQQGLPGARSMVFCLEDAISEQDVPKALSNLRRALRQLTPNTSLKRFVRPRHASQLSQLLRWPEIGKIDGFVLPKVDLNSWPLYRQALNNHAQLRFNLMPTLETEQVFDSLALQQMRLQLEPLREQICCLRIGGNDLMNLLGLKRMPGFTIYDTPLRNVIDQLVLTFRPQGFELSAPVFDFLDESATLAKELERDLSYGFFAKTTIHPQQMQFIEQQYRHFSNLHQQQAEAVLSEKSAAVFQMEGQMMERTCHRRWADRTLNLAEAMKS